VDFILEIESKNVAVGLAAGFSLICVLIEDFLAFSALARRKWSAQCVVFIHFRAWIAGFVEEIALATIVILISVMRSIHCVTLSKDWVLILYVHFTWIIYVEVGAIGGHIHTWCHLSDVAHSMLVWLNRRSDFHLSFEHNHVVIYPEQILFIYLNLSLAKHRLVSYYNNLNKILVGKSLLAVLTQSRFAFSAAWSGHLCSLSPSCANQCGVESACCLPHTWLLLITVEKSWTWLSLSWACFRQFVLKVSAFATQHSFQRSTNHWPLVRSFSRELQFETQPSPEPAGCH